MDKTFNLSLLDNGIALLTMDVPGESVNTLKAEFAAQIGEILQQLKADRVIRGLVLISGKPDTFVAGADITMLDACRTASDASELSRQGQQLFAEIEALPIPVVAAIHGACLGGGLELALACRQRICSDSPKTLLGLPEVQLGLLPGSGGTQRLPRLVGIAKALDMMLTGKQLRPKQALKMGLVDEVVPQSILLNTAIEMAMSAKMPRKLSRQPLHFRLIERTAIGRKFIFEQAKKQVIRKTSGNYPAPEKIIECVRVGMNKGIERGLVLEASSFGDLVATSESAALRSIFLSSTAMKKESGAGEVSPRVVKKVLVLGGGLMGGGIASITCSRAKLPVRVKDINEQGLLNALGYAYKLLDKGVKLGHMSAVQRDKLMALMTTTTDYLGVKHADIVVEAVFEDLTLKQQMVRDIERECAEHTVFASNTSSLPIAQIATAARRPEQVIGLHYFSPVEKMPLVEVIAHEKTSPETIATTVAFARRQGKTPIVVKDRAGFYVNRILAPYMNEAAELLLEGQAVDHLDRALVDFGFPVGPMQLLDEVGIDVAAKIAPILEQELGERFRAPAAFEKLLADNRKGRKNAKGFYLYGKKAGKKKQVDKSVYELLGIASAEKLDADVLAERCVLQMLNESARCLDEGIIASPRDGDIGAIFGIGFPPFLGGPFRYMDTLGLDRLVNLLDSYRQRFGERFTPAAILRDMAASKRYFYR